MARWVGALLLAVMAGGCGSESAMGPSGGRADGGEMPDASAPDAGAILIWPEPILSLENALDPKLVQGPVGERTLIYLQDGKVWAWRNPPEGGPVEVGAASTYSTEMSAVASPDSDRIFVAWSDNSGAVLTGGVPEGPAFALYRGMAGLNTVGTSWVGDRPVVTAFTNQLDYDGTLYPAGLLAFRVPLDSLQSLPLPDPADRQYVEKPVNSYHHYDESHRVLDLGEGRWLLFDARHRGNPADPEYAKHWLRWSLLVPDATSSGAGRNYLVRSRTGYVEMPHAAAWVQAQRLPGDRYVITYGASESSLVYDVHLVEIDIAEDGTPSLASTPTNISQTFGQTQNSDHALLLPAGDGRYWLVWRETGMGPLVALLDEALQPRRIVGPTDALECDMSSSLGAVVDAEGTLHLAAGAMNGDGLRFLRLFSFALP